MFPIVAGESIESAMAERSIEQPRINKNCEARKWTWLVNGKGFRDTLIKRFFGKKSSD